MSDDRDLLAEAAARIAKARAYRLGRLKQQESARERLRQEEIVTERLLDFLGERPITRDNGDYHV